VRGEAHALTHRVDETGGRDAHRAPAVPFCQCEDDLDQGVLHLDDTRLLHA
jgi:hypothetical protein